MTEIEDIRWLAGLYEGEGSCGVYGPYPTNATQRAQLSINSTDRDVLESAQRIAGCGNISRGRSAATTEAAGIKQLWVWQVQNRADVQRVCGLLHEHLHERRRGQMAAVLAWCEDRERNPRKPGPAPGTGGRPRKQPQRPSERDDYARCACGRPRPCAC